MEKTGFYSYKVKALPKGCQLCIKGRKLVLFVTGLCPRRCFYCPLSDRKKDKDIVWANERIVSRDSEIIDEARLCSAKGAGFTGGDPLVKMDRTIRYINLLKKEFGKRFHIHLYTSLDLVDRGSLQRLHDAGLDEIRFHPDIEDDSMWDRIGLAKDLDWDIGVEIPAIPSLKKETDRLISYLVGKVGFLNINELEISDNNANKLVSSGFVPKDRISYGVKGSQAMALYLLRKYERSGLKIHYCTAKLKDKVQLANRIKLRAKKVKRPYDIVTDEGMLIRGVIYAGQKELAGIMKDFSIPSKYLSFDSKRKRILIAPWILQEIYKEIPHKSAIVHEYPTDDALAVEVEFLGEP